MLRKQREEPLEEVPDAPDDAPVPDDAVVSTDNIQHLTELIGQMKPMYRDPLRLLAMGYTNREIAESLGLTDEVVRIANKLIEISKNVESRPAFSEQTIELFQSFIYNLGKPLSDDIDTLSTSLYESIMSESVEG